MGNNASPLRRAMGKNDPKLVKKILDDAGEGAPDLINEDFTMDCVMDVFNRNVHTPVHTALAGQKLEVLEILLQYGGDPDSEGQMGQTTLHRAALQNNLAAAKVLLQYGSDVHARDNGGQYPVHYAARSIQSLMYENHVTLTHLVEEAGKADDVHLKDSLGNTPLHTAVRCENLSAARYLLDKGADVHAQNDQGKTPLDVAHPKVKEQFRELVDNTKDSTRQ